MKVVFKKDFDFDLGGQKTAYCKAGPEPLTVKRELGEAAIAGGFAVLADDDKTGDGAKSGNLGGNDTGTADQSVSGSSGINGVDGNDDGDPAVKPATAKAR